MLNLENPVVGRRPAPRARSTPSPSGRIRTNLRVQRSTAVSCRGSGSRRLAGGHALAGRTCSQIRPPEGNVTNIVPRQPARGNAERRRLSALARACPAPAASTRIRPFAHPRAGVAARYLVRCVPGVGFESTFDLRTRDPRLTSYCRCRGNALRSSLALKLVRMLSGRGLRLVSVLSDGRRLVRLRFPAPTPMTAKVKATSDPSPCPLPEGIRTNLRVQRSTAVSCRGNGRRRLAGGDRLAGRTCLQIPTPESKLTQ